MEIPVEIIKEVVNHEEIDEHKKHAEKVKRSAHGEKQALENRIKELEA